MKKGSAISAVLKLKLLVCLMILAGVAYGQRVEHYNSPLYSPKVYDPANSQTANGLPKVLKQVGIEQKLGNPLPLDAEFKNDEGKAVKLGDYFGKGKPVLVALVYYECPMLCNEVLNGLTGSLKGINFNAGKEFDVVAISFDARENEKPGLAKNKRKVIWVATGVTERKTAGIFSTGTQGSIDAVTNAVGFTYEYDEATSQFAHAGGFIVTTPEGRISKYFYGVDYAPKDVKLSIMESAESKIGSPADRLLLYCFHYDPSTGTYGFAILRVMRVAGVATLLGMGAMFFVFWRRNKRKGLS